MSPKEYIASQEQDRQDILLKIHSLIINADTDVRPEVGSMMSKEMVLYKQKGYFKYGLASVKNYMSLHLMPIYMDKAIHTKYQALLPNAEFQKGCINFKNAAEISLPILRDLYSECAKINIAAVLEARKKKPSVK